METGVAFQQLARTTQKPSSVQPAPSGVLGLPGGAAPSAQAPAQAPRVNSPQAPSRSPVAAQNPPPGQPAPSEDGLETEETAPPARPAPPPVVRTNRGSRGPSFSFTNASIESVVSTIMGELKYTYLIDPRVTGNVNLYTQGEIPRDQLFPILEQILNLNGQAIVKQGELYIIVPLASSSQIPGSILRRKEALPTPAATSPPGATEASPGSGEPPPQGQSSPPPQGSGATPTAPTEPAGGGSGPTVLELPGAVQEPQLDKEQGVITYIIPLHYIPSSEMVTMVKAFVSDGAQVVDFQSANTLIITDYRANIRQALRLIELLDTEYFDINTVDLIPIRYNKAPDVAEDLGKVFAPGDKAGGVRIVAIERLNSILVVTHSPSVFSEVKRWIERLDAPSSGSNVKTFVYQVENNTAANIAEILAQLYENGSGLPSGETGEGQQNQQQNQQQQQNRRREAGFLPDRGQQQTVGPSLGGRSAQSGVRAVVSGNIKIIVNEFNNSLIIQGTEADYQFLEQTIRLLDILPRQVLIEAEIYSVELQDDLSYGISSFLQQRGSAFPPSDSGGTSDGPATTGSISSGGLSLSSRIFVGGDRQLGLILNALRSKTNVEILESPSLLVIDGTEAQINVGAEVPVSTTAFSDPLRSGDTAFVNSIQFRPTGTTLLLQPRISASGIVTMDLAVEVSSASGSGLTPTINRNFVQTSLIAQDNQTIMIAGIISDTLSLGRQRVPLLGDIPILGALFGQTSRNKRRFELLFLITPRVVRNLPTAVELTLDFKRALRGAYSFIDKKTHEREELKRKRLREEREEQRQKEAPEPSQPQGPPPPPSN